jgi:hypothetical protein
VAKQIFAVRLDPQIVERARAQAELEDRSLAYIMRRALVPELERTGGISDDGRVSRCQRLPTG